MTAADIEDAIKALIPLLGGDALAFEQGTAELKRIEGAHRHDAFVQYLIGSAYDSSGREALAAEHYDRVFALGVMGLPEHRRPELFVQAGSTLRNLGRSSDARALLANGVGLFPDYRALRIFSAMLETSAGDNAAAARHLYAFVLMAEDGSMARFQRSVKAYISKILQE